MLFSVAGGNGWTKIPGGERRARRILSRLGLPILPPYANPSCTAAVTHVVVPVPTRSLLWLCAVASTSTSILRPEYLEACDNAGEILPSHQFEWDCYSEGEVNRKENDGSANGMNNCNLQYVSKSQHHTCCFLNSKLWLGAAKFWRCYGPPLFGQYVLIVGKVRAAGSISHGVPTRGMLALMLTAAGAFVALSLEIKEKTPTFAIVPADASLSLPSLQMCIDSSILCLGAAFVPDLVSQGHLVISEYVVFHDQLYLVASPLTSSTIASMRCHSPLPISWHQWLEEQAQINIEAYIFSEICRKLAQREPSAILENLGGVKHEVTSCKLGLEFVEAIFNEAVKTNRLNVFSTRDTRGQKNSGKYDSGLSAFRKRQHTQDSKAIDKRQRNSDPTFQSLDRASTILQNFDSNTAQSPKIDLREHRNCQSPTFWRGAPQTLAETNRAGFFLHKPPEEDPSVSESPHNGPHLSHCLLPSPPSQKTGKSFLCRRVSESRSQVIQERPHSVIHSPCKHCPTSPECSDMGRSWRRRRRPPTIQETPESDAESEEEWTSACDHSGCSDFTKGNRNLRQGLTSWDESNRARCEDEDLQKPFSVDETDIPSAKRVRSTQYQMSKYDKNVGVTNGNEFVLQYPDYRDDIAIETTNSLNFRCVSHGGRKRPRTPRLNQIMARKCFASPKSSVDILSDETLSILATNSGSGADISKGPFSSQDCESSESLPRSKHFPLSCARDNDGCDEVDDHALSSCYDYVLSAVGGVSLLKNADCLREHDRHNIDACSSSNKAGRYNQAHAEAKVVVDDYSRIRPGSKRDLVQCESYSRYPKSPLPENAVSAGDNCSKQPPKTNSQSTFATSEVPVNFSRTPLLLSPCSRIDLPYVHESPYISLGIVGESCSGNAHDDDMCENDVNELFWLFNAGSLLGLRSISNRLEDVTQVVALARLSVEVLVHSKILYKLLATKNATGDITQRQADILLSFCARLLALQPAEDAVTMIVAELLELREMQVREKRGDPITALLTASSLPLACRQHYVSCIIWVMLLQYCESEVFSSSFWTIFNNALPSMRNSILADSPKLKIRSEERDGSVRVFYERSSSRESRLIGWVTWVLESVISFGSLYAVRVVSDLKKRQNFQRKHNSRAEQSLVCHTNYPSNWPAVFGFIKLLLSQAPENTTKCKEFRVRGGQDPLSSGDARLAYESISDIMRRVVLDIACGLWVPDEKFVIGIIEQVHQFHLRSRIECSCTAPPKFLVSLRHYSDVWCRRSILEKSIRSICDCVMLLSWMLVSQLPRSSNKTAGKIIKLGSSFEKSSAIFLESWRGFLHGISLTLSVADGITTANQENGEALLRGLLFSKVPKLARASVNEHPFGLAEKLIWQAALEAVTVRCRVLTSSNKSCVVYVEFVTEALIQSIHCLEIENDPRCCDIFGREASRVQCRLLLDLVVDIINTVIRIVDMQRTQAESINNEELGCDLKGFAVSDSMFMPLSQVVSIAGTTLSGIASTWERRGRTVRSPHDNLLQIFLRMLDRIILLVAAHHRAVGNCDVDHRDNVKMSSFAKQNVGFLTLICSLRERVADGLISVIATAVPFCSDEEPRHIQESSAVSLARLLGLSRWAFTRASSFNTPVCASISLCDAVRRAGFILPTKEFTSSIAQEAIGAVSQPTILPTIMASLAGRAVTAEFWAALCDPSWISSVLDAERDLESQVIVSWIVLLSAPEVTFAPQPVIKLAGAIKCLSDSRPWIQRFVERSPFDKLFVELNASQTNIPPRHRVDAISEALRVLLEENLIPIAEFYNLLDVIDAMAVGLWTAMSFTAPEDNNTNEQRRTMDEIHVACAAEILSLGFALRSSLGSTITRQVGIHLSGTEATPTRPEDSLQQQRLQQSRSRGVPDFATKSLDVIVSATGKLQQFGHERRFREESCLSDFLERLSGNIILGLSYIGFDQRDLELRVRFLRLAHNVLQITPEGLFYPLDHLRATGWLTNICGKSDNEDLHALPLQMDFVIAGKWRSLILQCFIQNPLTSSAFGSRTYCTAAENLLRLLQVHARFRTGAVDVSRDVRAVLSRIISSLPSKGDNRVHQCLLLRTCQRIGDIVKELSKRESNSQDVEVSSCEQGLHSLGLAIVKQVDTVLNSSSDCLHKTQACNLGP